MHEFLIAPSTDRAMWFIFLVPGLILFLVMGLLGAAVVGARSARFTTEGYSVLLSPAEPDQFLSALRGISTKP